MPSDQSTWLVSIPQDGDSEGTLQDLQSKLASQSKAAPNITELLIPSFKTGTLDSLISLSEDIPKQDAFFTATVARTVDTLRNLLNSDPAKLAQHVLVNERRVDDYLLKGWRWNEGRYGTQRGLRDMLDVLVKEMSSIDNVMKNKLQSYNLAKGSLVQMQRKKTGNLSVRSLADVVKKEHFLQDSEYMETLIVAVPKFNVRDFVYSGDLIDKQREELYTADTTEKELWPEPKSTKRTLATLQSQFGYLARRSNPTSAKGKAQSSTSGGEEFVGEYQTLLEQEFYDFVLFEVPWITL
ncbi:hypothetical protein PHLCEN_2v12810 [Hermanssonia centrifuga]|uniref:V-type proton ATPase subunit C n=1 Tax=Hermanssonia centrifuga TaxID=98765 RepID=A0A2R6NG09_9APHY|nr:hypothetical protein PHLCEN_2v12810 [Hermanssonia centrifuga]